MKKVLLSLLVMACAFATASAADFMVNGLGYNIIYNIINGDTVATTNVKVVPDESYATTLNGALNIPSQVTNNGTTYTVTEIGIRAFENCTGITSVVMPNTLTTILNQAFSGCSGLTSFNLPASVTFIVSSALNNCDNLTTLTVDSNNPTYDSRDNCNAIIHTSLNQIVRACNSTVIPSSVNSINSWAYSGCNGITSLNIPNNVLYIYDEAFIDCKNLASVNLPSTMNTIGKGVFENCSALTSLTIPASVVLIGEGILSGCSSLESIVVESENQRYDSRDNCNAIITKIDNNSYYPAKPANVMIQGCKNTTIPGTVTTIAKNAFKNCPITDIEITEGVEEIETAGFNFCTSLKTVTLPTTLKKIGVYGFNGCSGLTDIYAYPAGGSVTLGANAWINMTQSDCNLHVYPEDFDYYSTADQWKEFNVIGDLGQTFTDVYILGQVNGNNWAPNVGYQMATKDGVTYTADIVCTPTGEDDTDGYSYFSFTSELAENNDDGGWAYIAPFRFGAISNGDFLVQDDMYGTELGLTYENGQAYKIPDGEYSLSVNLETMKLIITKNGADLKVGDVTGDGEVDIEDVNAVINIILKVKDESDYPGVSDMNNDGTVDVDDMNIIINLILTQTN